MKKRNSIYWRFAKTLRKFRSRREKLESYIRDGSFYQMAEARRKDMLRRLESLLKRLRKLQTSLVSRLAGASIATGLLAGAFTGAEAQYFNQKTGAENPLRAVYEAQATAPTFVDIDADGDLDCFCASSSVQFYRNTGTKSSPNFESEPMPPFHGMSLGAETKIAFMDIDGDGDLDAFLGEREADSLAGTTKMYRNTGSATAPSFVEETGYNLPSGAAPAFLDIDGDSDYDLFLSSGVSGKMYTSTQYKCYENVAQGGGKLPLFQAVTTEPINSGVFCKQLEFVDIEGDKNAEAFISIKRPDDGYTYSYRIYPSTYFKNISPPFASFAALDPVDNPINGINTVDSYIAFADIDDDGDQDLFVGAPTGKISFYANEAAPDFSDLELLQPPNHLTESNIYPYFQWEYDGSVDSVHFVLSPDRNFYTLVVKDTIMEFFEKPYTIRYELDEPLVLQTKYYWRLKAKSKDVWSNWTQTWDFTTKKLDKLLNLVSPFNNSTRVSRIPTFSWNFNDANNEVTDFYLQVAKTDDFSSEIVYSNTFPKETQHILDTILEKSVQYWWRMKARYSGSWTDWTDVWTFTTDDKAPIQIIFPSDGETNVVRIPTLKWEAFGDFDQMSEFQVQISEANDFTIPSAVVYDTTFNEKDQHRITLLLDANKKYWQRMRGEYYNSQTEWTDAHEFTTGDSLQLTLLSPGDGETDVYLNRGFSWMFIPNPYYTFYNIQISKAPYFYDPHLVCNATVNNGDLFYYLPDLMESLTTYYWRVRVNYYGKWSEFTSTWSFTTEYFVPKAVFVRREGEANPFNDMSWPPGDISLDFADIDGDGDLDAFVGDPSDSPDYIENQGAREVPSFHKFNDYFNLGDSATNACGLDIVDIDDDGDYDLFFGKLDSLVGRCNYYENIGSADNPYFQLDSFPTPSGHTPEFVDLDGDADYDLFMTSRYAFKSTYYNQIRYFENVGTNSAPSYTMSDPYPLGTTYYTYVKNVRTLDIDDDGDYDAFTTKNNSSYANVNYFFENVGTPTSYTFTRAQGYRDPAYDITTYNKWISFADIDGDGDYDMFLCNPNGTIEFYENDPTLDVFDSPESPASELAIYPNPFESELWISFKLKRAAQVSVQICDLSGSIVAEVANGPREAGDVTIRWNPEALSQGAYLCVVKAGDVQEAKVLLFRK